MEQMVPMFMFLLSPIRMLIRVPFYFALYLNAKIEQAQILKRCIFQGWLKTFDEYYNMSVRSILDNAVEFLTQTPKMRFIWSEISFLEHWWRDANATSKIKLSRYDY
jgi:hypothetical protein